MTTTPVHPSRLEDRVATGSTAGPATVVVVGDERGDGAPSPLRPFLGRLVPALAVGFTIRLAFAVMDRVPSVDETAYLGSGLSLFAGDGFTRGGSPELHFPPLVPTLLGGIAQLTPDPHHAGVIVTLVAGTALLVPLAAIVRRAGGDRAGVYAAWIGAIGYGLAVEPARGGGGSEAIYTLLVLCALWAAVSIEPGRRRRIAALGAAAGVCCGLAYLARPEGLWIGIVMAGVAATGAAGGVRALWRRDEGSWSRAALGAGVLVLALAALAAPYVDYLHDTTGSWSFTAKTQDASLDAWRAVAEGDRRARDEVLYGLDESGLEFSAGRYPLTTLVREDPSGYAALVGVNITRLLDFLFLWRLIPTPLMLLALWVIWRQRRNRVVLSMVAVALVPVATVLAFFVLPRYLIVTTALLYGLCGLGLTMLPPRWTAPAKVATGLMMGLTVFGAMFGPGGFGHPREPVEQRAIGEWLEANTDPADRIMTRSQVVAFHSDRQTVALPYASPDETIRFGAHYGARYLVADEFILWEWRPQLRFLFGEGPWQNLRLVHEEQRQGRVARVFEIHSDEVPVDDDSRLPSLAHAADGSPVPKHGDERTGS